MLCRAKEQTVRKKRLYNRAFPRLIELLTRMHSSRMRTSRSSRRLLGGSLLGRPPSGQTPPGQTHPWADPLPGQGADTPQADTTPMHRMTHMCKNITLAQLRCGRSKSHESVEFVEYYFEQF